jgi:hypothetical protein
MVAKAVRRQATLARRNRAREMNSREFDGVPGDTLERMRAQCARLLDDQRVAFATSKRLLDRIVGEQHRRRHAAIRLVKAVPE